MLSSGRDHKPPRRQSSPTNGHAHRSTTPTRVVLPPTSPLLLNAPPRTQQREVLIGEEVVLVPPRGTTIGSTGVGRWWLAAWRRVLGRACQSGWRQWRLSGAGLSVSERRGRWLAGTRCAEEEGRLGGRRWCRQSAERERAEQQPKLWLRAAARVGAPGAALVSPTGATPSPALSSLPSGRPDTENFFFSPSLVWVERWRAGREPGLCPQGRRLR